MRWRQQMTALPMAARPAAHAHGALQDSLEFFHLRPDVGRQVIGLQTSATVGTGRRTQPACSNAHQTYKGHIWRRRSAANRLGRAALRWRFHLSSIHSPWTAPPTLQNRRASIANRQQPPVRSGSSRPACCAHPSPRRCARAPLARRPSPVRQLLLAAQRPPQAAGRSRRPRRAAAG